MALRLSSSCSVYSSPVASTSDFLSISTDRSDGYLISKSVLSTSPSIPPNTPSFQLEEPGPSTGLRRWKILARLSNRLDHPSSSRPDVRLKIRRRSSTRNTATKFESKQGDGTRCTTGGESLSDVRFSVHTKYPSSSTLYPSSSTPDPSSSTPYSLFHFFRPTLRLLPTNVPIPSGRRFASDWTTFRFHPDDAPIRPNAPMVIFPE